uniref:Uncharacterized protein n=1 Tax=Arundo donax TaxID=35708 RepID=A0A0A9B7B0_ARUDO
MQTQEQPNCC